MLYNGEENKIVLKEFLQKNKNLFYFFGVIVLLAAVFMFGRCTNDNSKQLADLQGQITELNKQYQEGIDKLSKGLGDIKESTNGIKGAVDSSTRAIINGQRAIESSIGISEQVESADSSAGNHIKTAIGFIDEFTREINGIK